MIRLGYDDLPTSAIRGTLNGPSDLPQPLEHTAILSNSHNETSSNSHDATPAVNPLEATSHSTQEVQKLPVEQVAQESQNPSFTRPGQKIFSDHSSSCPNPQNEPTTKPSNVSEAFSQSSLTVVKPSITLESSSQQQDKRKKDVSQGGIDDGWEKSLGDKRLNEMEREAALRRDHFAASFGPHSVECAKCGVMIQLNQNEERRYYLSLWKRHRRTHLRAGDAL